jgi:GxxExxY protein
MQLNIKNQILARTSKKHLSCFPDSLALGNEIFRPTLYFRRIYNRPMEFQDVTYAVRGSIFEVYKVLGPGLLESVYQYALQYELQQAGWKVRAQVALPVIYKNAQLDLGFRIDLLIEDQVVVEVKSVEALHEVHKKQLITYLKLSNRKVGLLVNFNVAKIEDKISLVRIVN